MNHPPQLNVDLSNAKSVVCDNCENHTFQEVVLIKFLSEVESPTGRAGNVPIPTFACNACGHVNYGFLPPFMRQTKDTNTTVPDETSTNSKLILN